MELGTFKEALIKGLYKGMGGGIGKLGENTVPEGCYHLKEGAVRGC